MLQIPGEPEKIDHFFLTQYSWQVFAFLRAPNAGSIKFSITIQFQVMFNSADALPMGTDTVTFTGYFSFNKTLDISIGENGFVLMKSYEFRYKSHVGFYGTSAIALPVQVIAEFHQAQGNGRLPIFRRNQFDRLIKSDFKERVLEMIQQ